MAKGRKRQKKNKKVETVQKEEFVLKDKLFIVFCIVLFFVAFYLLTLYITHKHSTSDTEETKEEVVISQEEILIGRSLSMSDGEYYVIFYDSSNEEVNTPCSDLVSNYRSSHEEKLYYVDMHSGFNSSYATEEESNSNPESVSDFKINGPTLIRVEDHKVVEYVEGTEAIEEKLK